MSESLPTAGLHRVTLARPFDFDLTTDVPSWWTGGRVTAGRGNQVVVTEDDDQRGLRFGAFLDEPPLPTHRVTIAHASFTFTPVPYPSFTTDGHQATALSGETIDVLEDDYQRGLRFGAFTVSAPAPSRFGAAGDPPLTGSRLEFLNWAQAAGRAALELLCDDVDQLAADHGTTGARDQALEVRKLLVLNPFDVLVDVRLDEDGGHLVDQFERREPAPLAVSVQRAYDLISVLRAQGQPEGLGDLDDELLARIQRGIVTNPDALRALLAGA